MAEQAAQNEQPVEEKIIEMEIERLRDFRNHPFHVKDDAEMEDLKNSIRRFGILSPIIVRPMQDGAYEIISGHRRKHAAKSLGYRKVPVIIRALEDDDAVISMVDSNLHREWISYSEKAFAIKMKYEAMKRNTGRRKKGSQREARPKGIRTVHILGEETGDSPKQIQRFLKITELIPEMMEQLDQNGISFNPAYEIAFLPEKQQKIVLDAMRCIQSAPSLSQAQRIRRLGEEGELTVERAREILSEVKKGEINRVTFKNEQLYQFFPRDYPAKKMKQDILDILREWKDWRRYIVTKKSVDSEETKESRL